MEKIIQHLAATAELTGQAISPIALAMMAKDLAEYPEDVIIKALGMLRRESKYRMTLAAIIEQIEKLQPDGRLGAEEAWAMIPHDEYASAVITEEMAQAWGIAKPLLDEGDKVAARMAFKEAYLRIVTANKIDGVAPKWFASLGHDKEGRAPVLAEAVRIGRLGALHAISLVPPDSVVSLLELAGEKTLALEYKPVSNAQVIENIAKIKAMMAGVKISS
jgi:hypothetical protein